MSVTYLKLREKPNSGEGPESNRPTAARRRPGINNVLLSGYKIGKEIPERINYVAEDFNVLNDKICRRKKSANVSKELKLMVKTPVSMRYFNLFT